MVQVNLRELVGKLNDTCRKALEAAAGSCLARTNYDIEIEHWLIKLIETPNADVALILRHYEIDGARVATELTCAIDRFKTGSVRPPALSPNLMEWIRTSWLIGSIDYGERAVRSGHLLCALLSNEVLASATADSAKYLGRISADTLRKELPVLTKESVESLPVVEPRRTMGPTRTPALDEFTVDLTARARAGLLDPVLCRDLEIRQLTDVLLRRRQNNPILIGDAGVGKTAVVEGFALRIAEGDVPSSLRHVSLRRLDLESLEAAVGTRGDFSSRVKSVLDEVKSSPTPIVLFFDQAHTLVSAAGTSGQRMATNLLKPALARGELRTIVAATWAEYKRYFENEPALARVFHVVKVDEPDEKSAVTMVRGHIASLEEHHRVLILDESIVQAVRLSKRYLSDSHLPDKAVSMLDTTCARIALSQSATPPAVEDCQRRIEQLNLAIRVLCREEQTGAAHQERIAELENDRNKAEGELGSLQEQWRSERELVADIHRLQAQVQAPSGPEEKQPRLRAVLAEVEAKLVQLQGDNPLVHPSVDALSIAETASVWTGVPVGRIVADELNTLLNLQAMLEKSIIGQSHALHRMAQSICTARANLRDPRLPIGVFLLAGPSGVGKTETAITLARLIYGGEQNMTVINMGEFKEEHKVSLLMGSPPGYVGYREGGVLTEAVRRKPYSVVLLDEMEKAHPGVQDMFYQMFDSGTMKDGEGRDIDFRNTVIIMTTNAGTEVIKKWSVASSSSQSSDEFGQTLFQELLRSFKPSFLGRLAIVPYFPLADDVMRKIIELKLRGVAARLRENYRAVFSYTREVVDAIAERCSEVDTGARNIDHILTRSLLPQLSAELLSRVADKRPITSVDVTVDGGGEFLLRFDIR